MNLSQEELEASPDYWWLKLRYAIRDGRNADADEARRRLKALGVDVKLCPPRKSNGEAEK